MKTLNFPAFQSFLLCGFLWSSAIIPLFAQSTIIIPSTWSYPEGSEDSQAPGFSGSIHQARQNAGLSATIARGNAQLKGELIDPNTFAPFVNLAVDTDNPAVGGSWPGTTAINPDRSFIQEEIINYSADITGLSFDEGNFTSALGTSYQDANFPGLPGDTDEGFNFFENGANFAIEFVTWLALPAGEIILGVHHDDAVEVSMHPNDARDIFRTQVVGFDSNSNVADRTVILDVEAAGLYPVRVLLAQWTDATMLEFYTAPVGDPTALTLVNDPMQIGSIKAWRSLATPTRPYVTGTNPKANSTGVAPATSISVTLENLGSEMPVLEVNGSTVTYTTALNGSASTLTYTPATSFGGGETVAMKLTYGNATAEWSFVTQTGRKAILITGGGQLNAADGWISSRLANQFGFDVSVISDGLVNLDDATDADLIFNSSTVNSGLVAPINFETLEIPLINVESFNADDFRLVDAPYENKFSNNPVSETIAITNAAHPLAAGLALGQHEFATQQVQFHKAIAPVNAIPIATPVTDTGFNVIFGIEAGSTVEDIGGGQFTHPARRVFFGHTGNDGASNNNEVGTALFDAAVAWALAPPIIPTAAVITSFEFEGVDFRIRWKSQIGRTYQVQIAEGLKPEDWSPLGSAITATEMETSFLDTDAADFLKLFYRIMEVTAGN